MEPLPKSTAIDCPNQPLRFRAESFDGFPTVRRDDGSFAKFLTEFAAMNVAARLNEGRESWLETALIWEPTAS
jgi:hypothetical protein